METHLADWLAGTPDGEQAEEILRKCVHCGFCTATCPTYQLLGDELDGPRGRIYLIKQVVEGADPTAATQQHLDRCLTCRNCESTCPSGVAYGRLVDVGRKIVDEKVTRPFGQRAMRFVLREGLTRRALFDPAMHLGKVVRPLLPAAIRAKVPAQADPGRWPDNEHARKVVLLNGCVQPAMMPGIDRATARVLDRLGIEAIRRGNGGCCGAVRHHLDDHDGALVAARGNIDAWSALIDAGAEALVINASGCGAMVREYANLLRHDKDYAARAELIVAKTQDLSEFLAPMSDDIAALLGHDIEQSIAFHPPCTLQHGQQIRGTVERLLTRLGATLTAIPDSHLCCGSAGTYSVTQPELSERLRERKVNALTSASPGIILSANIGCLAHIQSGTEVPVRHWIEWLDQALQPTGAA